LILQSFIKISSVFEATNLFSLSNEDILTDNGVSSINNSTPVSFSNNEIFLHSRQISFHLNSSVGKSITLEVNSLTVSAASFGIA
jgi:hypothetical protein